MASTKLPLISAPRVGAPPLWRTSRAHPPTPVWRNEGSYCRHHGHGGRNPLLAKQPQNIKAKSLIINGHDSPGMPPMPHFGLWRNKLCPIGVCAAIALAPVWRKGRLAHPIIPLIQKMPAFTRARVSSAPPVRTAALLSL